MRKSSKLNDYRRWFKNHFTEKELKAIVGYQGLKLAGVGPKGYEVRIEESNGKIISESTMTKADLLGMVLA